MKKFTAFALSISILIALFAFHYSTPSDHSEEKPLKIHDYEWLVGHWKGDGFGGVSEEIWAPPIDGTMMGMYRHYKDGKLVFYEFLLIDETGLKLKHFNPDLTGWETKEKFVTFPMIGHSKDLLEFKGLAFEQKSDTEMEIRLKMNRSGVVSTEVFSMKRVE